MGLNQCGLNMAPSKQELQPHGTLEFPCAAYRAVLTDKVEDVIPWHWHEELEVLYVKEGALSLKLPSKTYTLNRGDCAILNARVLHDAIAEPYCELDSFVFSSKLIGEETSVYYKKYLAPLIIGQIFDGHLVLNEENNPVRDYFLKAFSAMSEDVFGYEFIVRECLSQIFLHLYLYYESAIALGSLAESQDDLRIRNMMNFLHEHFSEDISLSHIAQVAKVSERECLRCFQRTINVSPMQYLLKYRVMQAAKLLENDMEKSISEVAREAGFDSLSYFSKVFKRFYKCTPSQYTKK